MIPNLWFGKRWFWMSSFVSEIENLAFLQGYYTFFVLFFSFFKILFISRDNNVINNLNLSFIKVNLVTISFLTAHLWYTEKKRNEMTFHLKSLSIQNGYKINFPFHCRMKKLEWTSYSFHMSYKIWYILWYPQPTR